jgi:hypothetical protein
MDFEFSLRKCFFEDLHLLMRIAMEKDSDSLVVNFMAWRKPVDFILVNTSSSTGHQKFVVVDLIRFRSD